jgi:hypothetical protein
MTSLQRAGKSLVSPSRPRPPPAAAKVYEFMKFSTFFMRFANCENMNWISHVYVPAACGVSPLFTRRPVCAASGRDVRAIIAVATARPLPPARGVAAAWVVAAMRGAPTVSCLMPCCCGCVWVVWTPRVRHVRRAVAGRAACPRPPSRFVAAARGVPAGMIAALSAVSAACKLPAMDVAWPRWAAASWRCRCWRSPPVVGRDSL